MFEVPGIEIISHVHPIIPVYKRPNEIIFEHDRVKRRKFDSDECQELTNNCNPLGHLMRSDWRNISLYKIYLTVIAEERYKNYITSSCVKLNINDVCPICHNFWGKQDDDHLIKIYTFETSRYGSCCHLTRFGKKTILTKINDDENIHQNYNKAYEYYSSKIAISRENLLFINPSGMFINFKFNDDLIRKIIKENNPDVIDDINMAYVICNKSFTSMYLGNLREIVFDDISEAITLNEFKKCARVKVTMFYTSCKYKMLDLILGKDIRTKFLAVRPYVDMSAFIELENGQKYFVIEIKYIQNFGDVVCNSCEKCHEWNKTIIMKAISEDIVEIKIICEFAEIKFYMQNSFDNLLKFLKIEKNKRVIPGSNYEYIYRGDGKTVELRISNQEKEKRKNKRYCWSLS